MAIFDNPLNDLVSRPSWITQDYDKKAIGMLMYAFYSPIVASGWDTSRVIKIRVDYTDGTSEEDFMDSRKGWCYFSLPEGKEMSVISFTTPEGYPTLKNYYISQYFLY